MGGDVFVTRRIDEQSRYVIKEIELRDAGQRLQERARLYGPVILMGRKP